MGRLVDAFVVLDVVSTPIMSAAGWLDRVVSAEPVLTPEIRRIGRRRGVRDTRAPAQICCAWPFRPRHARAGRRPSLSRRSHCNSRDVDSAAWARYARGDQFLTALGEGRAARAVWQALLEELEVWMSPGRRGHCGGQPRGAVIVPDQQDIEALSAAVVTGVDEVGRRRPVCGPGSLRPLPPVVGGAEARPAW